MSRRAILACVIAVWSGSALAEPLLQPKLRLAAGERTTVALTLDACGGLTDMRILNALIENRIPATIFVTAKWLRRNKAAIAMLKAHPDLFEIENHGRDHVPAVDTPRSIYGLRAAGSILAVRAEVVGGGDAIVNAGFSPPVWYRGATAEYSVAAIAEIRDQGYRVGGFSLNADQGASLGASVVAKRIAAARDGDVIIAHVNQPKKSSGAGVVKGIEALKARNVRFVKLSQATTLEGATN